MLFDNQDSRKQRELRYRSELKQELNKKKSQSQKQKVVPSPATGEVFGLLSQIEKEQDQRKKKNSDYYDSLRQQIEKEKQLKKEQKALQQKEELQQERKIQQEQQLLQQKYTEQLQKEQNKGKKDQPTHNAPNPDRVPISSTHLPEPEKQPPSRERVYSLRSQPQQKEPSFEEATRQVPKLYPNKIQNETWNYLPRGNPRTDNYKELVGQRKKIEEETAHISELNRVMTFHKASKKEDSRPLEQLRSLQAMLEDKNSHYLGLASELRTQGHSSQQHGLTPTQGSISGTRKVMDQWRKLD